MVGELAGLSRSTKITCLMVDPSLSRAARWLLVFDPPTDLGVRSTSVFQERVWVLNRVL